MRIVSLVPSHTETLHDIGVAVVGRTRFCIAPAPWVEAIPHVGGTKDASFEKIMALNPDLVVADKDENPKELVDQLSAQGIEVLHSEIDSIEDATAFIERLAKHCEAAYVGAGPTAHGFTFDEGDGAVAAGMRAAAAIRERMEWQGPSVPVFCPIWHPWMTFDKTAYPHAMLAASGFVNVFGDHEGPKYFEVSEEEILATGANVALLPTEPFPFHKQDVDCPILPLIIDGEALTWFGTRTAAGLETLRAVHGELP